MAEKNLTDEEILRMIEEFRSLGEEEKALRKIGEGSQKSAYFIPNTNYVIKEPHLSNTGLFEDSLIGDYIGSKRLNQKVPVETPILITDPKQNPLLIQRILKTESLDKEKAIEDLRSQLKENKIYPASVDLNPDNVGIDDLGKSKMLDVGRLYQQSDDDNFTKKLGKFKESIEKIKTSSSPRIYRSIPLIGPAIGAGLAAMSGDANAASAMPILGEADSLGPEQGSEDYEIENPQRNPAARRAALEKLSR